LRHRAIGEVLKPEQIGRALFHLGQRRGFKSNRKTDGGSDETGVIKEAAAKLETAITDSGAKTLGSFLWSRHSERESVRVRNLGAGAKAAYDLYPTRDMVESEFNLIWAFQAPHNPAMTEAARQRIHRAIFYQRPLREPSPGKCTLSPAKTMDDTEGFRCPWAHPLAQRFRIYQEVRNLAVIETGAASRLLSKAEGDKIALALLSLPKLSFDKMRALLKLPTDARFNLESEKRKELLGDETAARLGSSKLLGKLWRGYPLDRQIAIVERLLADEDNDALIGWLVETCQLHQTIAARVAGVRLPEGHCRLGLRAIADVLPFMVDADKNYPDAAKAAGYDHTQPPTGEVLDRLPYYGEWLSDDVVGTGDDTHDVEKRWGRYPNPTVHIGLNQLRRVVNEVIAEFGQPHQIVIEMARELKLSRQKIEEIEREQASNQRANERRADDMRRLGVPLTSENFLRMRLWEELDPIDRRCPYSGDQIGIAMLFSAAVEIDHIIPFSESLDDSAANKVVCMRSANRDKGNRTPFEAFGGSPSGYDWNDIKQRADNLPNNKKWRFGPDARERFKRDGGFLGRQLNETGWFARSAKKYLQAVCNPNQVWTIPGRLTAMLRGKWGLNDDLLPDHNFSDAKNRKDHRHHAIDALVAALTDRRMLQLMSSHYDEDRHRVVVPEPWAAFRDHVKAKLDTMVVSFKPDHGVGGKLHEATAFGLARPLPDGRTEDGNLVYRRALTALNAKEIERIRDVRLRERVQAYVADAAKNGVKLADALHRFCEDSKGDVHTKHGVRHVRLLKREQPQYLVPVADDSGQAFKFYSAGDNAYVDIVETEDGKWLGEATTVFQANQPGHIPAWRRAQPACRFIMRVHKGDLIRLEREGATVVMVALRLDAAANRFKLAAHNETGNLDQRHANPEDPFRWLMASYGTLKTMKAERVRVDTLGRVWRVPAEEGLRALRLPPV
jgi:CRISPR-associated endonuclease Csn1